MRDDIWEKWLKFIDKGFRIQNRKVLLFVDNAPFHILQGEKSEDEVQDNPEPEEAGRPRGRPREGCKEVHKEVHEEEHREEHEKEHEEECKEGLMKERKERHRKDLNKKLILQEAIDFISDAWEDVSDATIRNCWKATRIMPEINEPEGGELKESLLTE
ncbi:21799_t:CDS:2, partial [Gigaspora rosea]